MIKTLYAVDFDGTLCNSPEPEEGKKIWEDVTGEKYPHIGWWSKTESLDTDVFDIDLYDTLVDVIKKGVFNEESYAIILTNRLEKLRPEVQNILDLNNVGVDFLDMKKNNKDKGERILEYLDTFPDLEEINVYDDRPKEIESFKSVIDKMPSNISFNIYLVDNDNITLANFNNKKKIVKIIKEEIIKFFK